MGIEQNCFFFSTFTIVCNADAFVIRAAVLRVRKTRAIHRNVADDGLDATSTVLTDNKRTPSQDSKTEGQKRTEKSAHAYASTTPPPHAPRARPPRGRQSTCSKVTAQGVVTAPARQEVMMVRRRRRVRPAAQVTTVVVVRVVVRVVVAEVMVRLLQ